MTPLFAVIVAFLASGDFDYVSSPALHEIGECHPAVYDTISQRLEDNKAEEDKVVGFSFECVSFDRAKVIPLDKLHALDAHDKEKSI